MYQLISLIQQNPNHQEFSFQGNRLYYQGKMISLENFSLDIFLRENDKFVKEISILEPDAIFHILDVHVKFEKMKQVQNTEEKMMNEIKQVSPEIKDMKVIHKKNEDGFEKTYVYYIDQYGVNHILYKYAPTDILKVYQELLIEKKGHITEKDLYEALNRKLKEIPLETLEQVNSRENAKEDYKERLKLENEKNNTRKEALGNEKHGLYITDMGDVINFQRDKDGNLLKEEHLGGNFQNDVKSLEMKSEISEISEKSVDFVPLISAEKYESLIMHQVMLSEEEQNQVFLYEGYVFDLMVYQEYLLPGLQEILSYYYHLIEILSSNPNLSMIGQDALKRFYEMQGRKKNIKIQNVNVKFRTLEQQKPSMQEAGYVSYFLFGFLLLGSIVLLVAGILFVLS